MMSSMGTNIKRDLEPKQFINIVLSCPVVLQQFPALNSMASTMQTAVTGYETLNKQLEELRTKVKSVEKTIDNTQSLINKMQESVSGVLAQTPSAALQAIPLEGTIVPVGGLVGFQNAIVVANETMEKAKDNLEILNDQILALEEKIEKYYTQMIDKVKEYVASIANTKVI